MLIGKHNKKVHKKYKKRANKSNNIDSNCAKVFRNIKQSTKHMKQTSVNMLTVNAAGLKHKASDLKDKIKYFNSTIFSVQETHFATKGKFAVDNYVIFESIRKSKEKGGSMLGAHIDVKPVLVKEYSDSFELIVVEVEVGTSKLRIITGTHLKCANFKCANCILLSLFYSISKAKISHVSCIRADVMYIVSS